MEYLMLKAAQNGASVGRLHSFSSRPRTNHSLNHRAWLLITFCAAWIAQAGVATAGPKPPARFCTGSEICEQAAAPAAEGIKWNPGHYMQVLRGSAESD